MHLSSTTKSAPPPPVKQEVTHKEYIEYTITQSGDHYTLNGKFKDTKQQTLLADTFQKAHKQLMIKNTSSNQTLLGDPALTLTNTILPHFIANYVDAKIIYRNEKIKIMGKAKSYEAQHEMQRLLNTSTITSQDDSSVIVNKPMHYSLDKKGNTLHLSGVFHDQAQIDKIKAKLPGYATSNFKIDSHYVDTNSLPLVEKLLPAFVSKYTEGQISYKDETLSVSGKVHNESELKTIQHLLADSSIKVNNQTMIDPIIAKREKEAKLEAARQAKVAAEAKAKLEAANRVQAETKAKLEAIKKAKEDTEAKAKLEATKKAKAEADAKAKREAALKAKEDAAAKTKLEAAKKAKAEADAKRKAAEKKATELKAKMKHLFQLENIEFNVNKSTLTTKGIATVNKLAKILKQYPSIKIEIAGHTDSDGSEQYNQRLSQSRVDQVKSNLIKQHIAASRLTAKGYGESKPLVPNTSDANKQKNRRVDINIQGE